MTPDQEQGQALLLRDLLRLPRTFRWAHYRVDVLGFIGAWLAVAAFIAFYWGLSKW